MPLKPPRPTRLLWPIAADEAKANEANEAKADEADAEADEAVEAIVTK